MLGDGAAAGAVDTAGNTTTSLGSALKTNGLAGTPVLGSTIGSAATATDNVVNPLASVTVATTQLSGGSGSALLGASALGATQSTGAALNGNVLAGNQAAGVTSSSGQGVAVTPTGGVLSGVHGGLGSTPVASVAAVTTPMASGLSTVRPIATVTAPVPVAVVGTGGAPVSVSTALPGASSGSLLSGLHH